MHFTLFTFENGQTTVFPTAEEIYDLTVGDWGFDCFGHAAKVIDIVGRGFTYDGNRPFVQVYVQHGPSSKMSACFSADTFELPVGLHYTSDELMMLQRQARLTRQVQL